MAELPHVGKQCSKDLCKQLDFLPIECNACNQFFCRHHIACESHDCTSAHAKSLSPKWPKSITYNVQDVRVSVCPICNRPVPVPRDEKPDVYMNEHIERGCKDDPNRRIYKNYCSMDGCKGKEAVPMVCNRCGMNFCLDHRFETDHNCTGTGADTHSGDSLSSQLEQSVSQKTTTRTTIDSDSLFHKLPRADGISNQHNCICFSASGEKVVGYDEELQRIVSIDLLDEMLSKTDYEIPDFNIIKHGSWLKITSVIVGETSHFIALVVQKGTDQFFAVSLSLDKKVLVFHEEPIGITVNKDGIADLIQDPFGEVYFVQSAAKQDYTLVDLVKLHLSSDSGHIVSEIFFDHLQIPEPDEWILPFIFDDALQFLTAHAPFNFIIKLNLPTSGNPMQYMIVPLTNGLGVDLDCSSLTIAGIFGDDHIIYGLVSPLIPSNTILLLNLRQREWKQSLESKEGHSVFGRLFVSRQGRVALNGLCLRPNCNHWHFHYIPIMSQTKALSNPGYRNVLPSSSEPRVHEHGHNESERNPRDVALLNVQKSIFIPGFVSEQALCMCTDGKRIIGLEIEPNVKRLVTIYLNDDLTRTECDLPSFETIPDLDIVILGMETVAKSCYLLVLLKIAETERHFAVTIALEEQVPVKIVHELELSLNDFMTAPICNEARLFNDSTNTEIYLLREGRDEEIDFTEVNLIQLSVNNIGQVSMQVVLERSRISGSSWGRPHVAFIYEKSLHLLHLMKSVKILTLPIDGAQVSSTIYHFTAIPEFDSKNDAVLHLAFTDRERIFYCLTYPYVKRNILFSLDMNNKTCKVWFKIHEHAIDYPAKWLFSSGKLAMNGRCLHCDKWHLYHFSIDDSVLYPIFGRRVFPSLEHISVILSDANSDVLHGEKTLLPINSLIMIIKVLQTLQSDMSLHITVFITDNSLKEFYSFYHTMFSTVTKRVSFVFVSEEQMWDYIQDLTSESIFIDNVSISELTHDRRILFFGSGKKKKVMLINGIVKDGCDHPRTFNQMKWFRMPNGSESKDNHKTSDQLIKNRKQTKGVKETHINPLDQYYPHWQENFKTKHKSHSQTICIPPCADVEKVQTDRAIMGETIQIGRAYRPGDHGREAERKLTDAILSLQLGGVLITGFKSKEFMTRIKHKTGYLNALALNTKSAQIFQQSVSAPFEVDAIFIHAHYGIVIFECKAKTLVGTASIKNDPTLKKAVQQLEKVHEGIIALYKATTDMGTKQSSSEIDETKQIHCIVVYPNSIIPELVKETAIPENEKVKSNALLWDSSDLHTENLRQLLEKFYVADEANLNNLAKSLVAYRSLAFISLPHNALEVHRKLDGQLCNQNFAEKEIKAQRKEAKKKTEITHYDAALSMSKTQPATEKEMRAQRKEAKKKIQMTQYDAALSMSEAQPAIYLSEEQLEALECSKKCQIISGPPGTGKTVLILLKALNALMAEQSNRRMIYIASHNNEHTLMLQQIMSMNVQQYSNISINKGFGFYELPSDDDDIFYDEMTTRVFVGNQPKNYVEFLQKRQQCKGRTIVAFTGSQTPSLLAEIDNWIKDNSLNDFEHSSLRTVFRGSQEIFNRWKKYFKDELTIGHNIMGQPVNEVNIGTVEAMLKRLVEELRPFTSFTGDCEGQLNHIAIILNNEMAISIVKSFLAAEGIPSGTVAEQVTNPNVVVVDWYVNCLSYDWPVVYVVAFNYLFTRDSFYVIACSRAIARLFILKRDYMTIQREIDDQLSAVQVPLVAMSYSGFVDAIYAANQKLQECYSPEYNFTHDIEYAMLRHDFRPNDLLVFPIFSDCTTLAEVLNVATKNVFICELIIEQDIFSTLLANMTRTVELDDKLPTLLADLWQAESRSVESRKRKYFNSMQQLINFFRETSSQGKHNGDYSKEQKATQSALRESQSWQTITDAFYILMSSVYLSR